MGVTHTYANKNKEQPWGFIIQYTDYKTVEKIVLCVTCCFRVVVSIHILRTLVFQEFQVIHELLNTLLVQLQNHSELCILKTSQKNFENIIVINSM